MTKNIIVREIMGLLSYIEPTSDTIEYLLKHELVYIVRKYPQDIDSGIIVYWVEFIDGQGLNLYVKKGGQNDEK